MATFRFSHGFSNRIQCILTKSGLTAAPHDPWPWTLPKQQGNPKHASFFVVKDDLASQIGRNVPKTSAWIGVQTLPSEWATCRCILPCSVWINDYCSGHISFISQSPAGNRYAPRQADCFGRHDKFVQSRPDVTPETTISEYQLS